MEVEVSVAVTTHDAVVYGRSGRVQAAQALYNLVVLDVESVDECVHLAVLSAHRTVARGGEAELWQLGVCRELGTHEIVGTATLGLRIVIEATRCFGHGESLAQTVVDKIGFMAVVACGLGDVEVLALVVVAVLVDDGQKCGVGRSVIEFKGNYCCPLKLFS